MNGGPPAGGSAAARRRATALAALVLAAILARALHACLDPVIERDGVTFLLAAREAREMGPAALLRHDQHPLYPALVAAAEPLLGDWERAGLLVAVLAGGLTVVPVVLLGERVGGWSAALLGGCVFAVSRYPVQYSGSVLSDGLHGLCFAASAWVGACALGLEPGGRPAEPPRARGRLYLLSGLLSGLAYLTRPEGLAAAAALGLASLAQLLGRRDRLRAAPGWLRAQACLALGLLLTAGPYAAYLSLERGEFCLSRKKSLLETLPAAAPEAPSTSAPTPPEPPAAVPAVEGGGAAVPGPAPAAPAAPAGGGAPRSRLVGLLRSMREAAEGLGWVAAGLAVLGLLERGRRREHLLAELYLLVPALLFVAVVSGVYVVHAYTGRRHFYPLTTLLMGLSGLGLVAVGAALGNLGPLRRWAPRLPAFLTALFCAVVLPKALGLLPGSDREKDRWMREAGLALRNEVRPGERVLAVGAAFRAAFYTGAWPLGHAELTAPADLPRAWPLAEEVKATWVLVEAPSGGGPPPAPPPPWSLALRIPTTSREVLAYRRER